MDEREEAKRAVRPLGITKVLRSLTNSDQKAAPPPVFASTFQGPDKDKVLLREAFQKDSMSTGLKVTRSCREPQPFSEHNLG